MKLYNLQECFEALGSEFPFTVLWKETDKSEVIKLTFIGKREDKYDVNWILDPKSVIYKKTDEEHYYWARQSRYCYKFQEFNKEMNDLLDSNVE